MVNSRYVLLPSRRTVLTEAAKKDLRDVVKASIAAGVDIEASDEVPPWGSALPARPHEMVVLVLRR